MSYENILRVTVDEHDWVVIEFYYTLQIENYLLKQTKMVYLQLTVRFYDTASR